MPFVNVKITREGGTTPEQKAAVIRGVTRVLEDVLDKDPATTFVVVDEVELEDWGVGGEPVAELRRRAPPPRRTPAPSVGHVGLSVRDLGRSLPFYRDVVGLELLSESSEDGRRYAFLGRDGEITVTLWQQAARGADRASAGLHHLAFQVGSIERVLALEARLRERGVPLLHDGVVPHGEGTPSGGVFFEDPDGLRLEVYAPTGAAERTAPTPGAPSCGFF